MGSFKYLKIPEEEYRRASEFDKNVYKNIPLVAKIVSEAVNYSKLDQDDLFQIGLEALVEAVQKYDPSKKRALSTFVGVVVRNRVYYNIKTNTYDVKVAYGTAKKVREAEKLNETTPNNQTIESIVNKMGVSAVTAKIIINLSNYSTTEISSHYKTIDNTEIDNFDAKVDTYVINNVVNFIIEMISLLPITQAVVLILRLGFYDGHTHTAKDVGLFLNKSEEYIRKQEARAIQYLRGDKIQAADLKAYNLSDPWEFINNRVELNNRKIDKAKKKQ